MNTPRTIRNVPPPDLTKTSTTEVKEEGNLVIEAVSLLVQRQRETESWVSEQIWQAEERAAETERRYAELEARLAGIEEHLARLVHDIEPPRGDAVVDERLERLREQVAGLKSEPDSRPAARSTGGGARTSSPAQPAGVETPLRDPEPVRPMASDEPPRYERAPTSERASTSERAPQGAVAQAAGTGVGFWELLGSNPQDRAGVLLIGAGGVAVLYALLTQLRV